VSLGLTQLCSFNKTYFPPTECNAVLVILDFRSTPNVVHPMNIHVNINLHQQSGFGNKDNQASQEM
jgi:hypothetical protein